MKKNKIHLTEAEWRFLIHSLNTLKTKMICEGGFTDTVDDVMYKIMKAPVKKVKIA